ncbi:BAG domain-containing protein [Mycena sanguinolenta]|uniref:BAG domain-containing protein n=1 Tax=Mycena sanguinolenta TaxID=230812 RepID=A0A8H6Z031_9AGAR|nr:BAG domain-containing protein [Mycena sanguinolenta]
MFHQSYPSAFSSYRSPASHINSRDKYFAALAEAKAAEAEYLAAEQLQQEEIQLRQRLEQIQSLKHQPNAFYTHSPAPHYPHAIPLDLEALRRQIVAEERARIVREQELEALRVQEAQRKSRELEGLRMHEARKVQQVARDMERSRAFAAQRTKFEALTHRALVPSVRFVVSHDAHRPNLRHRRFLCPESCKTELKPAEVSVLLRDVEAPITLEQLMTYFLSAVGVDFEEPPESTSNAATSTSTAVEKKETSCPASVSPRGAPDSKPAPPATAAADQAEHIGLENLLNNLAGAAGCTAASSQCNQSGLKGDLQQLFDMFIGGEAHCPAPAQPQASSSKSAFTTNDSTPVAKRTEEEEREERELQEAIRLSLADLHPSPTTSESKGKAPAPAPVKDVASSTAEVHAIDASFIALANEFVFPPQLDFSTSRTASPTRNATAEESVIAKLSYSPQNQPVRFYHQALNGLLARLDAVDSFGDEGLRHERKEVVGRVEG